MTHPKLPVEELLPQCRPLDLQPGHAGPVPVQDLHHLPDLAEHHEHVIDGHEPVAPPDPGPGPGGVPPEVTVDNVSWEEGWGPMRRITKPKLEVGIFHNELEDKVLASSDGGKFLMVASFLDRLEPSRLAGHHA